jgi:hypothetical protein
MGTLLLGPIIRRMSITSKKDLTDSVPALLGSLDILELLIIIYLVLALTTTPSFWFLGPIMTPGMTLDALPLLKDLSTSGSKTVRALLS